MKTLNEVLADARTLGLRAEMGVGVTGAVVVRVYFADRVQVVSHPCQW